MAAYPALAADKKLAVPAKPAANKKAATTPPPAAPVVTPAELMGAARADVIAAFGKPLSALKRGDVEVLIFAKGVRFEIQNDAVISAKAGDTGSVIERGGERYTPTDKGRVERIDEPVLEEDDGGPPVPPSPAVVPRPEPVAPPPVAVKPAPAKPAPAAVATPPAAKPAPAKTTPVSTQPVVAEKQTVGAPAKPGVSSAHSPSPAAAANAPVAPADGKPAIAKSLSTEEEEELMSEEPASPYDISQYEEKPEPPWKKALRAVLEIAFRFGFSVLILRMALSFVELPCYMPDMLKVAALYTVVREGVHGISGMGGNWEYIEIFRIDDGMGFIALSLLLFHFKVVLTGLSAMKVAAATTAATYVVMYIIVLALLFGLGSF